MDIEKSWNEWKPDENDWDNLVKGSLSKDWQPRDPLIKLRKNMQMNMGWAILICFLYIAAIIYFPLPIFRICIIIMLGFTCWAAISTYHEFKRIEPGVSGSQSLLEDMEKHYTSISRWMKASEKVALFFYPIGAIGGFFMGGVLGSGKSFSELITKPIILISLLIVLVILVPAAHYLAKWMNKKAFGDHLKKLKENIDQLKNG